MTSIYQNFSGGFESQRVNHTRRRRYAISIYGCVAQLAEQLTLNQKVAGSMPVTPTKYGPMV